MTKKAAVYCLMLMMPMSRQPLHPEQMILRLLKIVTIWCTNSSLRPLARVHQQLCRPRLFFLVLLFFDATCGAGRLYYGLNVVSTARVSECRFLCLEVGVWLVLTILALMDASAIKLDIGAIQSRRGGTYRLLREPAEGLRSPEPSSRVGDYPGPTPHLRDLCG